MSDQVTQFNLEFLKDEDCTFPMPGCPHGNVFRYVQSEPFLFHLSVVSNSPAMH